MLRKVESFLAARLPAYGKVNEYFTYACFATPPILGSVASFIFHGGALWCLFEVLSGRRKFASDRVVLQMTAALWLLVLVNVAATLLNLRQWDQLTGLVWVWTLFVFPFSYSIWRISDGRTVAHAVLLSCAVASYGGCAIAIVQYYALGMRAEGGAGNAIVFATITAFASSLALVGALRTHGVKALFYFGAFFAGLAAIMFSGTRGVWPAVVVNVVLVAVMSRRRLRRFGRFEIAAAASMAVAAAALFGTLMLPRFQWIFANVELIQEGYFQTSTGMRLIMWKAGLEAWQDSMLIGLGSGAAHQVAAEHLAIFGKSLSSYTHLHNQFVTTLVESGLVGLTALLAVMAIALKTAVKTLRADKGPEPEVGALMLLLVVVTFVTAGMTSIMIGHDILDAVFVMSLVVGIYLCRECGESAAQARP